ncbi:MAG: hypothetical protein ABFS30_01360 [Pseudomonadota bacterium]
MNIFCNAIAAGAIVLTAGLAGAANAAAPSPDTPRIGSDADVTAIGFRHCVPVYGYRKVHFASSSRVVLVRHIVRFKCFPIAVIKPKLPIPDPGPYRKDFGKFNPRAGF